MRFLIARVCIFSFSVAVLITTLVFFVLFRAIITDSITIAVGYAFIISTVGIIV